MKFVAEIAVVIAAAGGIALWAGGHWVDQRIDNRTEPITLRVAANETRMAEEEKSAAVIIAKLDSTASTLQELKRADEINSAKLDKVRDDIEQLLRSQKNVASATVIKPN